MATNQKFPSGWRQSVAASNPTTPASGDPVRYGSLTGVALIDEASSGLSTVDLGPSAWSLSVKGVDDNGNSAVAAGDAIFYVDADTPKLSKKASGYLFGFALGTVGSGSTATITVWHSPSPGAGTLAAGGVGATQLADSGVTTAKIASNAVIAAKLTATLATGFIPLPLPGWRLIASADIPAKGTPDGGLISLDTAPVLSRINVGTDPQLRIAWVATGVVPITQQFAYPPDLDDAAAVVVKVLVYKDANANAAMVLGIGYFEGIGDTNAGTNTAAITETAAALKSVTVAAGDIGAAPNVATVVLTPGAHANDALYLLAAWVEYTRK